MSSSSPSSRFEFLLKQTRNPLFLRSTTIHGNRKKLYRGQGRTHPNCRHASGRELIHTACLNKREQGTVGWRHRMVSPCCQELGALGLCRVMLCMGTQGWRQTQSPAVDRGLWGRQQESPGGFGCCQHLGLLTLNRELKQGSGEVELVRELLERHRAGGGWTDPQPHTARVWHSLWGKKRL